MAAARPGLAYQKRAGQPNNNVGRFYMAINQVTSACAGFFGSPSYPCDARLIMTEGNLSAGTPASRRLTWITPAFWLDRPNGVGGIALIDDPARDTNLRAAFARPSNEENSVFAPLADGIVNTNLSDFDDRPYVYGALRASLCLDGGSWPTESSQFGDNICPLPAGLQ